MEKARIAEHLFKDDNSAKIYSTRKAFMNEQGLELLINPEKNSLKLYQQYIRIVRTNLKNKRNH